MPLPQYRQSFYVGRVSKGVKWLIIVNTALYVLQYLGGPAMYNTLQPLFLVPDWVVHKFPFYIWQLFTYMFFHGSTLHLLLNMLVLWMFGTPIEQDWGTRRFLRFYFLSGIVAGMCDVALHAVLGQWNTSTIGASGAIYGLLAAFGVLYADAPVLMFLLFPMKAKHMVLIFAGIEFLATLGMMFGPASGVSSIAHLGGMAFGYLYLKRSLPRLPLPDWGGAYRQWRMERAKKKFQVYMRNRGGRGPWVN
jgi:membrane associated rhomboid family serine protease